MRITPTVAGAHHAKVYLDGEELTRCVEADEDEGWARCTVQKDDGHILVEMGEPVEEIKRGAVRVEFDDPAWRQLAEAAIALEQVAPEVEVLVTVKGRKR